MLVVSRAGIIPQFEFWVVFFFSVFCLKVLPESVYYRAFCQAVEINQALLTHVSPAIRKESIPMKSLVSQNGVK